MARGLIWKELRETRLFAAVALAIYFVYLSRLMGFGNRLLLQVLGWVPGLATNPVPFPFVKSPFAAFYGTIAVVLAVLLGFRQSAADAGPALASGVLPLPLSRRRIFLVKLGTGLGLQLSCTLLPVLVYASWTAFSSTAVAPFYWSMTGDVLRVWLVMTLVYLGAFASGIHPGRWYGSRLLPLIAVAIPAYLLTRIGSWWLIGAPLLLSAALGLASSILLEAETRDF